MRPMFSRASRSRIGATPPTDGVFTSRPPSSGNVTRDHNHSRRVVMRRFCQGPSSPRSSQPWESGSRRPRRRRPRRASPPPRPRSPGRVRRPGVTGEQLAEFARRATTSRRPNRAGDTTRVDLVLTNDQAQRLRNQGLDLKPHPGHGERPSVSSPPRRPPSVTPSSSPTTSPAAIRDQLVRGLAEDPGGDQAGQARHDLPGPRHPRPQGDPGRAGPAQDGSTPRVNLQRHPARPRVDRTEMDPAADEHHPKRLGRRTTRRPRSCCRATELWFMPVMNPDGYQYTFDDQRLWRKNLRDNNGDGITPGR